MKNNEAEIKNLIQLKKNKENEIKDIVAETILRVADLLIEFFENKGIIFKDTDEEHSIKLFKENNPQLFRFEFYLQNKGDLPDIFDNHWYPHITIENWTKNVDFYWLTKKTAAKPDHHLEGCNWYWEKERFETFYNRKLKKIFEK